MAKNDVEREAPTHYYYLIEDVRGILLLRVESQKDFGFLEKVDAGALIKTALTDAYRVSVQQNEQGQIQVGFFRYDQDPFQCVGPLMLPAKGFMTVRGVAEDSQLLKQVAQFDQAVSAQKSGLVLPSASETAVLGKPPAIQKNGQPVPPSQNRQGPPPPIPFSKK